MKQQETAKQQGQQKLTIYFTHPETMKNIDKAYSEYLDKYQGLATTRNRFITALLIEGIDHYVKDNAIAWGVA